MEKPDLTKMGKLEASGKQGKKPTKSKKPKEPASLTEEQLKKLPKLPKNWKWVSHSEIATINPPKPDGNELLKVSFLPMPTVEEETGRYSLSETRNFGEVRKGYTGFIEGDVIFAKITPCMENGKVAYLEKLVNGIGFGSTEFHVSRPTPSVFGKYLFHYLVQQTFRKEAKRNMTGSAGQLRVPSSYFAEQPFPLAPLPEQRAIVSKIEQLFSELDNGISNLKLAQEQLKVYRQAVLKKAFEGELTREWRKLNSTGESANKLLDLILEKKKSQWENNQLDKFKRTGKKPKDNLWKLKYKRPCSPDLANLPDLPKSWSWVSPEQITSWEDPYALAIGPFGSNLKVSDYTYEGVPLVFVRNIRSGVFDNENTKYVSETKSEELRPHWINSLDILVTKMGEPPGDACLYPIGHPLAIITADCIKFRLCSLLDNPTYFVYAINSNIVRSQISSITLGVAQKKISLERFKTIALPLPPIEEQQAIVQEIETRLSVCDKIEQDIKENLEKAEALRQSI